MDVSRYLEVLRLRWKSIAVLGIVGAILGILLSLATTPQYRSTTTLFFYLSGGDSATQLLQGSTYAQNQVRSFALLAEQPVVLEPVIAELGLDTTSNDLAKSVTTNVPLDTVVMEISVTDTSPTQAAAVANAIGTQMGVVLTDLSPGDSATGGAGADPANGASVKVSTVAPATPPGFAYSPTPASTPPSAYSPDSSWA